MSIVYMFQKYLIYEDYLINIKLKFALYIIINYLQIIIIYLHVILLLQ